MNIEQIRMANIHKYRPTISWRKWYDLQRPKMKAQGQFVPDIAPELVSIRSRNQLLEYLKSPQVYPWVKDCYYFFNIGLLNIDWVLHWLSIEFFKTPRRKVSNSTYF